MTSWRKCQTQPTNKSCRHIILLSYQKEKEESKGDGGNKFLNRSQRRGGSKLKMTSELTADFLSVFSTTGLSVLGEFYGQR